jgi:FMN phosphatase YigB (HAD superfamily)
MDAIDTALARVQARLERERQEGRAPRTPPPDRPAQAVRRTPRSDDQLTRERKQAMWDAMVEHAPELAQLLRDLKKQGITATVETLRLEAAPDANHGPDPRPFNAVRIEARLPDRKSKGFDK